MTRHCLFQPAPGPYDHSVDEREHSVEQWKDLIYEEVMEYELTHGPPATSEPTPRKKPEDANHV